MTEYLAPGKAVAASAVYISQDHFPADTDVPRAGFVPLATLARCEVGVWEHSVGTSASVEEDEVAVVVAGSATIRFADGSDLHIAAGDVLRLAAGMRTTWTVHQTLRKIYVCPVASPATPNETGEDSQ